MAPVSSVTLLGDLNVLDAHSKCVMFDACKLQLCTALKRLHRISLIVPSAPNPLSDCGMKGQLEQNIVSTGVSCTFLDLRGRTFSRRGQHSLPCCVAYSWVT